MLLSSIYLFNTVNNIDSFQQLTHTKESFYSPPNAIPWSHPHTHTHKKKKNRTRAKATKELKSFQIAIHKLYQPFSSSIHLSNVASNNSEERTNFPLSNANAIPKTTKFTKHYSQTMRSQKPFSPLENHELYQLHSSKNPTF